MSIVAFLKKLLDGADVEWVPLGNDDYFEVANKGRKPVKASLRVPGETPYYGANNVQDFVDGHTHDGEYLLVAEDGSSNLERYSIQYAVGQFWANNHVHVVQGREKVNTRFLFYYLTNFNFLPFLTGGGRAKLTKGRLIEIPIPIPCPEDLEKSLAIQGEIVRILDSFTGIKDELTAQLAARKKQYNHYRDRLLNFDEGIVEVEWKPLSALATIQRGASPRPISKFITYSDDGVSWIKIGDTSPGSKYVTQTAQKITIEGAKKSRMLRKGDFIISNSMSFGRPYILKIDGAIHDGWASVSDYKNQLHSGFLYHYLSSKSVQNYWLTKINSGSVSNLNSKIIQSLKVPIPFPNDPDKSLEEQARIVAILDKFDTFTTSLRGGLPHEIKLRQQQYEYYRDQLLSFESLDEGAV